MVPLGKRRVMRALSLGDVLEGSPRPSHRRQLRIQEGGKDPQQQQQQQQQQHQPKQRRPYYRSQSRKIFFDRGGASRGGGQCSNVAEASIIILKEPEIR